MEPATLHLSPDPFSASVTLGQVCVLCFTVKGPRLCRTPMSPKSDRHEELTRVSLCPCGLQLILVNSSWFFFSTTLYLSFLSTAYPMSFKPQNQMQKQLLNEAYKFQKKYSPIKNILIFIPHLHVYPSGSASLLKS